MITYTLFNLLHLQLLFVSIGAFQLRPAPPTGWLSQFQQENKKLSYIPSPTKRSDSFKKQKQTSLFSLQRLIDDLSDNTVSGTRTVFVGGKGTKERKTKRVKSYTRHTVPHIIFHHGYFVSKEELGKLQYLQHLL